VVVLVGAAVITTWLVTRTSGSAASAAPIAVTTQKVTVSTGTIKQTVSASGTIEPASQADLSFAVSGQVTAVNVAVGQKVTSGQTLATLNTSALQYQAQAASETLSSAQSRLSTDQSSGASTSQIASDQASVTSAESQLATAQQNLANANLASTISGTVASINLSVGQMVSGSGSTGNSSNSSSADSGTGVGSVGGSGLGASASSSSSSSSSSSAQIVVVSTNSYNVSATVDDTQVGQVKVGDQVTIQPGSSTTTVYGTVSSVGLVAQSSGSGSSSVASFPVVVAVTGTPSGLYAGTSATLTITTRQLNNVAEVPTSAISYSNGQATVTQVVGGSQKSVPVTTGAAANGETQITSGLEAGDVIIERVVKFNGTSGGSRNLFGGGGTGTRTGGLGGGGFPGVGGGGFPGGGFAGGGG
jgi:membrane fusion protein, macrolide-specific efflux system